MIKLKHVPIYDPKWFKYWLKLNRIQKLDIAQARWRWCLQKFLLKPAIFCHWLQFFHEPLSTAAVLAELRSVLEALNFRQMSFGEHMFHHVSSCFCLSAKAVSDRLHANGSLSAGSPGPWLLWAMCHPLFITELSCCNVFRTNHPTAVQLHCTWISLNFYWLLHLSSMLETCRFPGNKLQRCHVRAWKSKAWVE